MELVEKYNVIQKKKNMKDKIIKNIHIHKNNKHHDKKDNFDNNCSDSTSDNSDEKLSCKE